MNSADFHWTEGGLLSYIPMYTFFQDLCRKFQLCFLVLLAIQKLNQGLWHMVMLASQDYFK